MQENSHVEMGWGAPAMKEQHPILSDEDCAQFDRDNHDLSRLAIRGLLSRSAAAAARAKYAKSVGKSIRAVIKLKGSKDEGDLK